MTYQPDSLAEAATHPIEYDSVHFYPIEEGANPDIGMFGYFPRLLQARPDIEHGFQWVAPDDGSGVNISFSRERKGEEVTAEEAKRVVGRIQRAFDALGLGDVRDAILAVPEPGDTTIVVIRNIAQLKRYPHTSRGYMIPASAVFCSSRLARTIYAGGLDCAWTMLATDMHDGEPEWYGLVHTGRSEAKQGLPTQVVELLERNGYPSGQIDAAMAPSLEQDRHELQGHEVESQLGSLASWGEFVRYEQASGTYYPDVGGRAALDYIHAGIEPGRLERYCVGTYEASENGFNVSYRHQRATGVPASSFFIGIRAGHRR